MKKYIPHILGAIFVLVIIGAWMLIAHLAKKPSETQVPMLLIIVDRQYERAMPFFPTHHASFYPLFGHKWHRYGAADTNLKKFLSEV